MLSNTPVLCASTVRRIGEMGLLAEQIAFRWATGWPHNVQSMEAHGQLCPRLMAQAQIEAAILAKARATDEFGHLADHEILQLHDVAEGP